MLLITEKNGERKVIFNGQDITDKCIRCTCYMYDRKGVSLTELLLADDLCIETENEIDIQIDRKDKKIPQKKIWDSRKIGWLAILISLASLIICSLN